MEDTMKKIFTNAQSVIVTLLSVTLCLSGVLNTSSTLAARKQQQNPTPVATTGPQKTGQLIATGSVSVNEKKAVTGTAIFSDSVIAVDCAQGNRALVDLGAIGRIELTEGTKLRLRFSDGMISGELQEGKAVVSAPEGVKVQIDTQEGPVTCDGQAACVQPVITQQIVRCVQVAAVPAAIPAAGGLGTAGLAAILVGTGAGAGALARVIRDDEDNVSSVVPR